MNIHTADDLEKYAAAQGAVSPQMKLLCLLPILSAAHDKKILIDDAYIAQLKKSLTSD